MAGQEDTTLTPEEAKAIADAVMERATDAEVNAKAVADFIMRGA